MISVWKRNEEIRVITTNEYLDVTKIKTIIKTVKKIHKSKKIPRKIIFSSKNQISFSQQGELFYRRILAHKKFEKLIISFEPS